MYATINNILCFIADDDSLQIVEPVNNDYIKTTINNEILELATSISLTSNKKLFINTIDSETHILNLNNNTHKKILWENNIDGIPANIIQYATTTNARIRLIYDQKSINIKRELCSTTVTDLYLIHDEIIISVTLLTKYLLIFTNFNTKIFNYDLKNNTCCTKNETIKVIQKKYHCAHVLDQNIFFFSDYTIDIYEKNFIDNRVILLDIKIKNIFSFGKCIYVYGKTHNKWIVYCCSDQQQEKNDTIIITNEKNYYMCKIFDKICDDVYIYQSCTMHANRNCTCELKYILLVYESTNIEFIDIMSNKTTHQEMEYQVKNIIIINCRHLIIVTDTNNLKYYEITQDIDGEFIMNYRGEDEHKLKFTPKYSKKALHHLLIINDMISKKD